MSRRYLNFKLWAAGRLPADYRPTFSDVSYWLAEGSPPAGQVEVAVTHQHVVQRR